MSGGGPANTVLYDANGNALGSSALISNVEQQGYGSSLQVWVSGGPGVLPAWGGVPGGASGATLIATVTASASASVNFDNQLTSTYDNYFITFENLLQSGNAVIFEMVIGIGSASYQATNYLGSGFYNASLTTTYSAIAASLTYLPLVPSSGLLTTVYQSGGNMYIYNANNGGSVKNFFGTLSVMTAASSSTSTETIVAGGSWYSNTGVLTSVKFLMSAGTITTGTFKLYGFKN